MSTHLPEGRGVRADALQVGDVFRYDGELREVHSVARSKTSHRVVIVDLSGNALILQDYLIVRVTS